MSIVPEAPVANRTPVPADMRLRVLARTYWSCFYCGYEATRDGITGMWDLEVDHVIPRWAGGPNCDRNLVAACRACNNLKGRSIPPAELVTWAGALCDLNPEPDVDDMPLDRVAPTPSWRDRCGRPVLRPVGSHLRFAGSFKPRDIQCPACLRWMTVTGEVMVVGGETGVVYVMACYHCETSWEVDAGE